ncbi:Anaerobic sulfite reductase iron-sulfur subunit [Salinivirga cyanobacteriivorans]|uniref:Anaerobic sulfite reductase iron-sulfur subunit n=1 Tax=Salinivirga cyanobacteriivorans TaxID=1307839 RepID=A0A0S2HY56_9BACT|nr:4Fe-4S dicluster domain-containing protein [Salinivirga cyanobacteriivorans]ALO14917.1 Anaerobic sulfite reductase iron-sulfur subunit [Salinivirga cyanobacteriivorans]
MTKAQKISWEDWFRVMKKFIADYRVYAPLDYGVHMDYEIIDEDNFKEVVYNKAKPITPLKSFFLPVKENLTATAAEADPVMIIGMPSCDLKGLSILKEIYLDAEYPDTVFKHRLNNTVLVGTDCFSIQEHCHCTSYGIDPVPVENADLSLSALEKWVILTPITDKGDRIMTEIHSFINLESAGRSELDAVKIKQDEVIGELNRRNADLPDYESTRQLMLQADEEVWKKYAHKCVSCGACATICPTCTCFLLIDRPGFEKVRHLDACQYPGFERVAAGEDPLGALSKRFRNRYFCKYVWKPEKFNSIACTGCGRCIEACIGKISKNEMFVELNSTVLSV